MSDELEQGRSEIEKAFAPVNDDEDSDALPLGSHVIKSFQQHLPLALRMHAPILGDPLVLKTHPHLLSQGRFSYLWAQNGRNTTASQTVACSLLLRR